MAKSLASASVHAEEKGGRFWGDIAMDDRRVLGVPAGYSLPL